MKKKVIITVVLAAVIAAGGIGAGVTIYGNTQKFDEGTTINGIDVSGLTVKQAQETLAQNASSYSTTLGLEGNTYDVSAESLGLALNPDADLGAILQQQNKDNSRQAFTVDNLYTVDKSSVVQILSESLPVADKQQLAAIESADAALGTASAASADAVSGDASASADAAASSSGDASGNGEVLVTLESVLAENGIDSSDVLYKNLTSQDEAVKDSTLPKNAYVQYDSTEQAFVIRPSVTGECLDSDLIVQAVDEAVQNLPDTMSLNSDDLKLAARIGDEDETLNAAADNLNSYLDIDLTYTFTPLHGDTTETTLDKNTIGSFLELDGNLDVRVNEETLGVYADQLAQEHSTSGTTMPFDTSGGTTIDITVADAGETVDSNALYEDLLECISNKQSGTREAPYIKEDENSAVTLWGGNYVEIDLTSQTLWYYKDGECLVSAPIVSGNVSHGHATPTGVFTIYSKDTNRYLRGTNDDGTKYKSYVHYFLPFCGGVGMHDASWRSSFGGTTYLYGGSHGCINMRYDDVKIIFDNITVGTHVIVYGGEYVPQVYVPQVVTDEEETSDEEDTSDEEVEEEVTEDTSEEVYYEEDTSQETTEDTSDQGTQETTYGSETTDTGEEQVGEETAQ